MKKISLSGEWKFTKDQLTKENFMTVNWEPVTVPHTWNGIDGQNGGNNYYRGLCWYQKTITVKDFTGRVFIEFEGVNSVATVLVNGELVGTHKGGYSTFRFDITDYVTKGENLLLVGADNKHYEDVYPLMADFTFYGGIYRDVHLVYTNDLSFDLTHMGAGGVYISQKEISYEKAKFSIDAYVKNYSEPVNGEIHVYVKDHIGHIVLSKDIKASFNDLQHISMDLELEKPHLWNGVADPYLYDIHVELYLDGKLVDNRIIPTGFRFYHFDANAFYLNGEKLRLNGVSRHQDRWEVGNALTKEMHDEDMELMKEIGVNSIRLAHYQQADYFYDLCDREGMVIWAEIPYISISSKTDHTGANAISQMEELVKQNYNHSSILMWGVQNEITIQGKRNNLEQIVQNLHDLTKEWDPYRLTTQAHVAMHPLEDSMHDITDIIAYNNYFGWYMGDAEDFSPWLDEWRRIHPDKPIGLSEYGAEGIIKYHTDTPEMKDYTEEYHALWHEKVYSIFESKDYVWGTYVWNMFAFAADARDEGGVKGLNNKGLVTIDRKVKKDAFFYYKAKWTKEPMLHLCSKRFVERHNKDIEVKAYSNNKAVAFYLNDELVNTVTSDNAVFTTKLSLQEGENKVKVVSGDLSDEIVFVTVDEMNPTYSVPKAEQGKGIFNFEDAGNWFDDLKDQPEEEITIDSAFYSINDVISDILDNPQGKALFEQYMSSFLEHPMFEMAKGFTIKMIMDFDPNAIPRPLIALLNKELQKIKK